ncbi:MAG: polyphosphate kinase 1 [Chitinophagales bacterium]
MGQISKRNRYVNREISWLAFNERVLQEAEDSEMALLMRIKFLGIFSNNLDEFFRVRVASLKRIISLDDNKGVKNKEVKNKLGFNPKKIMKEIHTTVMKQQKRFERIYEDIKKELMAHDIHIIDEQNLTARQGEKVIQYFHDKVRPVLVPIMIKNLSHLPKLKDGSIYLAVVLEKDNKTKDKDFALIEIPTSKVARFFVFEREEGGKNILLLDDVIRYSLHEIFSMFGYDHYSAYTVKITKDAETDIDNDVSKSFLELMSIAVQRRTEGRAVRFIHDQDIDKDLLAFLIGKLKIRADDNIIPAGRYHNFKDFMDFPTLGPPDLSNRPNPPLAHKNINPNRSLFKIIKKRDIMLHFPYQSFHPVIDFLREAAIDPKVKYVKATLYRVAKRSNIINALISAKKNGKDVTVVIELQARFDEEANIRWAKELQSEGVKVVHGQQDIKIHSKLLLVGREEEGKIVHYANISTGNFNEDTARVYADDSLLTAHKGITKDVFKVFKMIESNQQPSASIVFNHLLVSPYHLVNTLFDFIDIEIANAKANKEAYIIAKMNGLNDEGMIEKLYEASQAGVIIQLIIRGICSLKPGVKGLSDKIEAISIVDKYLEHSRVYIFCNGGNQRSYISSADWMERNLRRRIEVACPVYDEKMVTRLKDILTFQWKDNVKARIHDQEKNNPHKPNPDNNESIRAQNATYDYFKSYLEVEEENV